MRRRNWWTTSVPAPASGQTALQRRRDRRCNHLRAGAGIERGDLDGRIVHLRQGGLRQQPVTDNTDDEHRQHQEAGGNGTPDERLAGFMLALARYRSGFAGATHHQQPRAACGVRPSRRHQVGPGFARRVAGGACGRGCRCGALPGAPPASLHVLAALRLFGVAEISPGFLTHRPARSLRARCGAEDGAERTGRGSAEPLPSLCFACHRAGECVRVAAPAPSSPEHHRAVCLRRR